MTREQAFLDTLRGWVAEGRVPDPPVWLQRHRLDVALSDLAGDAFARTSRAYAGSLAMLAAAEEAVRAISDAGIPIATLKGIDLLGRLYDGREGLRTTGDLDLLTPRSSFSEAMRVVESLGYEHYGHMERDAEERLSKDVMFRRHADGVLLELHHELMIDLGFTHAWDGLDAAGDLEHGTGLAGSSRLTLDALAVFLLVHMAKHRFGADSLRWVLDIAVLLDRHAADLDARRLQETARRLAARRAAGATVAVIERAFPTLDVGPLAALPRRDLRERWAMRLIDFERAAIGGRASTSKRDWVLSRILLEPSLGSAARFVWRKFRIRRYRAEGPPPSVRPSGSPSGDG